MPRTLAEQQDELTRILLREAVRTSPTKAAAARALGISLRKLFYLQRQFREAVDDHHETPETPGGDRVNDCQAPLAGDAHARRHPGGQAHPRAVALGTPCA